MIIKSLILYNKLTGEILESISINEDVLDLVLNDIDPDKDWVEVPSQLPFEEFNKFYVNISSKEVVPKIELNPTFNELSIESDDFDEMIISNIPIEINSIWIDDNEIELGNETSLTFTSSSPGKYLLKIDQFPYKYWEQEIEVLE